jgi:hypothetical protein
MWWREREGEDHGSARHVRLSLSCEDEKDGEERRASRRGTGPGREVGSGLREKEEEVGRGERELRLGQDEERVQGRERLG